MNSREIEEKSFCIINRHLKKLNIDEPNYSVIRRVIHATADFKYVKDLCFSRNAVNDGIRALKKAKCIIVDANMIKAGINKKLLSAFGCPIVCYVDNKKIAREAVSLNTTRAALAMRKAAKVMDGGITAIGNAPSALFELCRLIEEKKAGPALVVGVPVGFVGAKESKMQLRKLNVSYITNRSRKGGSSCAVAIVNAILKLARQKCI